MDEKKQSSTEKTSKKTVTKKATATKKTSEEKAASKAKAKSTAEAKKAAQAATKAAVASLAPPSSAEKKAAPSKRKTPSKKSAVKIEDAPAPVSAKKKIDEAPFASSKNTSSKLQGVTRISSPPRVKQELKKTSKEQTYDSESSSSHSSRNSNRDDSDYSSFSQPETVGGEQGNKRNNKRRNRGRNRNSKGENIPQTNQEIKVDPDELSKKAWKIFLGEVNEDGLALMDDNSTREVAKRSFRVAEIFLQEEIRRKNSSRHQNNTQASHQGNKAEMIEESVTPLAPSSEKDEEELQIDEEDDILPIPEDLLDE